MSKNTKYALTLLIFFSLDNVLTYFLPYNFMKTSITLVPSMGLMMFTLINNHIAKEERYIFAVLSAAYFAIVYADSLAIYVLIYVFVAWLGQKYVKYSSFTLFESTIFVLSTILIKESSVYLLMRITRNTMLHLGAFVTLRLGPTLIFNAILFVFVYYTHKKFVS